MYGVAIPRTIFCGSLEVPMKAVFAFPSVLAPLPFKPKDTVTLNANEDSRTTFQAQRAVAGQIIANLDRP